MPSDEWIEKRSEQLAYEVADRCYTATDFGPALFEVTRKVEEALREAARPRWRPVSEAPEIGQRVHIAWKDDDGAKVNEAFYQPSRVFPFVNRTNGLPIPTELLLAWMPMPEPPGEGG